MERSVLDRFYGAHFDGGRFNQYHRHISVLYEGSMTWELKENFAETMSSQNLEFATSIFSKSALRD
jgi:hypothetical protein